ncbi:MAG: aldo/keto reductase [Clostridia bacterium]|nr:aldo/keto reductase [Clostridia bacterium]
MKYRRFGKEDFESSLLGFGTMRLPTVDNDSSKVDEGKAIELLRYAIDEGVNYIDSAYIYHGGNSEVIVGKALKNGYRDKVKVATKLPVWKVEKYSDFERLLDEQRTRLDVDCIDIFLLHSLNKKVWNKIKKMEVLKFLNRAKEEGKIKYTGFSTHDDFDTFKEIIDSYNWSMCLIQLNYLDINEQVGIRGLEYAGEKGIAVAIMEPLKGGLLANPPEDIEEMWRTAENKRKPVEWSFRWLANFPEVKVILSGMNDISHIKENIEILSKCEPSSLSDDELRLIEKVAERYREKIKIHCTRCGYCMPCPVGVDIPKNFFYYNNALMYEDLKNVSYSYQKAMKEQLKASNCISCGKCEKKCPQSIKISQALKEVDETLSSINDFSGMQWRIID